jgi:hypothetical protein
VLQRLGPESGGKVEGKENLKKYFSMGIQSIANLHMELIDVLIGIFLSSSPSFLLLPLPSL